MHALHMQAISKERSSCHLAQTANQFLHKALHAPIHNFPQTGQKTPHSGQDSKLVMCLLVQTDGEVQFNGVYWSPPKVGKPGEEPSSDQTYTFSYKRPPRPRALRIYECHVGMSSQVCVLLFSYCFWTGFANWACDQAWGCVQGRVFCHSGKGFVYEQARKLHWMRPKKGVDVRGCPSS